VRILIFLFLLQTPLLAQTIKIVDGDTIHINNIKYRFHGMDAPEMKQTCKQNNQQIKCGVLARNALVKKIGNQNVRCKKITIDRYKRIIAECFVNGESLSKHLVRNGYAFAYRRYSKQFIEDENFAREQKLGLWQMQFEYPWNFRRKN
jgi:endonuclease YncB( thermonuclease family)